MDILTALLEPHTMEPMDLERLWELTLTEMRTQLPPANFATWLKNSRLLSKEEGLFRIALPSQFAKKWVEEKYPKVLLGIIRTFDDSAKKLEFVVENGATPAAPEARKAAPHAPAVFPPQADLGLGKVDPETNLNPRYTMKNFVVGAANELAYSAAMAVVQEVGTKYNPFFVYGGVGLGKTHLVQMIGNEIQRIYRGAIRPRYVSSEKFTSDVIWAIRNKRMEDIKKRYRDVDVLIIDDIQFIGGKEKTEEEFFHTFNALYEHNKQIVISSDRPPQAIPTLEERLRSRFEGGLIADIGYPEYEMRLAIIKTKLEEAERTLPEGVVELMARRVKKNIRELEGVLTKVLFEQDQELRKGREITERMAEDTIEKSVQSFSRRVSDDQILTAVAEFFRVGVNDLITRGRKKEVVEPRQIAMFLMRDILDMSYPYIGDKLGRDHTTAIHAVEKITQELNRNSALNQKITLIKEAIFKLS